MQIPFNRLFNLLPETRTFRQFTAKCSAMSPQIYTISSEKFPPMSTSIFSHWSCPNLRCNNGQVELGPASQDGCYFGGIFSIAQCFQQLLLKKKLSLLHPTRDDRLCGNCDHAGKHSQDDFRSTQKCGSFLMREMLYFKLYRLLS